MWILGISGSHNSGAALIKDGKVVVAIQTERLVRRKRQSIRLDQMTSYAGEIIRYCLEYAHIDLPDLEVVATSTPWPSIHPRFVFEDGNCRNAHLPKFVTVPHHLSHAEYALHYSPLQPCIVLVCDGSGTYEAQRPELDIQERKVDGGPTIFDSRDGKESISAYAYDGADLKLLYRIAYGSSNDISREGALPPGEEEWLESVGHLWEWSALYCHGSRREAGKVMGLAPYGNSQVYRDLNTLSIDATGRVRINLAQTIQRFRSPNVDSRDITGIKHYEDVAAHVQHMTNLFLGKLVDYLQKRYRRSAFCYSGGVALNGIANEYLKKKHNLTLWMNGSCEDNGTAIGAALAAYHKLTGYRVSEPCTDYYGREYSDEQILVALRGHTGEIRRLSRADLLEKTARALASGLVVGWFQGRSEFGPRALGNRSILADPRNSSMKEILNKRVKNREGFRPYAPAVTEEKASKYFDLDGPSPSMLRVVRVLVDSLPAITHVDGSARVQTVSRKQNPLFYELLAALEKESGFPVVLNTSFNIAGEPIVETPADALRTFGASAIDMLVLGDFVVQRAP